jgi:exodeoxyribonuclease VII small subunit
MSQLPIGDDASPEDEAAQGTGPPSEGPQGEHEQGEHELSYERASGRIEEIIHRLDSGEAGLRETLELVAEGRRLVEFCATELEAVGRGLEELRLDELVARLERGDDGPAAPRSA